ncbi:MAG: glutamate 5-kinase [Clostridia bacterium]|nr:glutamate 5-kinase [Clostridia bacterium]
MKIVVKVGSSTLTHKTGRLNIRHIEDFVKVLSDIKNAGNEIILVSSGAIAMGVGKLQLSSRPTDIATKQAAAAVGQCELMYTYDKLFGEHNHTVAQKQLTADDLRDDKRHQNFENTMSTLLSLGVIPIINENDTVSTQEIVIGDNDTLSAIVAESVKADLLILLSDIDGLYDKDPHKYSDAKLIREVRSLTPEIYALAGGSGSSLGTGGMVTKLKAAEIATTSGVDMVITNGNDMNSLYDIVDGKMIGTRFYKV